MFDDYLELGKYTNKSWVSKGTWWCTDPSKKNYFPPEGVKLKFKRHSFENTPGVLGRLWYAKITVDDEDESGLDPLAKKAIEDAVFTIREGTKLQSTIIVLRPSSEEGQGLLMRETIELVSDKLMKHKIYFSDGQQGLWSCEEP